MRVVVCEAIVCVKFINIFQNKNLILDINKVSDFTQNCILFVHFMNYAKFSIFFLSIVGKLKTAYFSYFW